MRCFKILELHNESLRIWERARKTKMRRRWRICVDFYTNVGHNVWVHIDRLLLTGTALLNFAAWKKTTSRSNFPWFAFKLSAKPIWWKRYWYSRNILCQKNMLQLLLPEMNGQGRPRAMVLGGNGNDPRRSCERLRYRGWSYKRLLEIEDRNSKWYI